MNIQLNSLPVWTLFLLINSLTLVGCDTSTTGETVDETHIHLTGDTISLSVQDSTSIDSIYQDK